MKKKIKRNVLERKVKKRMFIVFNVRVFNRIASNQKNDTNSGFSLHIYFFFGRQQQLQ